MGESGAASASRCKQKHHHSPRPVLAQHLRSRVVSSSYLCFPPKQKRHDSSTSPSAALGNLRPFLIVNLLRGGCKVEACCQSTNHRPNNGKVLGNCDRFQPRFFASRTNCNPVRLPPARIHGGGCGLLVLDIAAAYSVRVALNHHFSDDGRAASAPIGGKNRFLHPHSRSFPVIRGACSSKS